MTPYNRDIEPPAPFLDVTVEHPTTGQRLSFPAKLDMEVIVITEPHALLGRDVLNYFYTRLNGPDLTFDLSLSAHR